MQLLQINLLAIRDLLFSWKRLLWVGPVAVFASGAIFLFYYLLFSVFLAPVIEAIIPALPFETSLYGWFILGLIFPIAGALRALSVIWIRADSVIYTEDKTKWIAPFGQTLMISAQAAIYLFGMAMILWLINYALVPRIDGQLIWTSIPAESVLWVLAFVFFPMWSRIWLFPATGAVEGDNTSGIWNSLCAQTSGYNFLVLLIAVIQAVPGILILFLLSQLDLSALKDAFENIQTVRPEILGQIIKTCPPALILLSVGLGGIYLSWLGVAQVETIRFFMAAPLTGGGNLEELAAEDDESRASIKEALGGEDPSLADANKIDEDYVPQVVQEEQSALKQSLPSELLGMNQDAPPAHVEPANNPPASEPPSESAAPPEPTDSGGADSKPVFGDYNG